MTNPLKVLFVFNHPAPYKVRLFNALAKDIDLHVLFERSKASNRNPLFYQSGERKFTYAFLKGVPLGEENHLSMGIVRLLKRNTFDLIVMNGYSTFSEMLAIRYLKKHKIPYIFYINGGIVKKESRLKFLIKRAFITGAEHYFSPCVEASEYLTHYGVDASTIFHYPYATIYDREIISEVLSSKEKLALRQKEGIPGEQVFVSISQFIKRKNNFALLKAWKQVDPRYSLVLIGEGPQRKQYEQFIKENRLTNVYIKPFLKREALLNYIRMFDHFILLSKEDIYGHVINEAFSQGLDVIATPQMVAARHLIHPGKNGYLVNYLDEDDILEKIAKLIEKPLNNRSISTAKNNTIEVMAESHIEAFRKMVK